VPRSRSSSRTHASRARTATAAAVLLIAGVVAANPASALAQSATGGGGARYVAQPRITKVSCIRRCASRKRARAGSTLRVLGSGMSDVGRVVFLGSTGRGDDVPAKVRPGSDTRLNVRVPFDAITGRLSAQVQGGPKSRPSRTIAVMPPPPADPNPTLTPVPGPRQSGAPRLLTGTSRTRAFLAARRTVTFSYLIRDGAPSSVRVELVRVRDGVVTRTWTPAAAAGRPAKVAWNGKVGKSPAPQGRYAFRLTVAGSTGALAKSAQAGNASRDAFDLYPNAFPVPGRHNFGQGAARFGAGRSGHTHQGQDVPAPCGARMVAARGGRIKTKAYHRAAGNYLVIDADGTSVDYMYAHLAEPTPFAEGDRVYTGQRIGSVGETGDAQGCHLHIELWTGPGWYSGGHPFDPLPSLKAWDAWS
jgi:murein DD-endopeptidase MepM/ murein hydrolase activator NlpD